MHVPDCIDSTSTFGRGCVAQRRAPLSCQAMYAQLLNQVIDHTIICSAPCAVHMYKFIISLSHSGMMYPLLCIACMQYLGHGQVIYMPCEVASMCACSACNESY